MAAVWLLVLSGAEGSAVEGAQVPTPATGTNRSRTEQEKKEAEALEARPIFEFHSGFWLNLHHILYQQARIRAQRPTSRPGEAASAGRGPLPAESLALEERREWSAAIDYYAGALASRDLLFDGDMVLIKNRLAEIETAPDLSKSGLRPELVTALERAAPVYRARWWAEHDRANRAWITEVAPLVRQLGARLAQELARIYRAPWPAGRVRVDVSAYAGPFGGYTSLDPLHITISSTDLRNLKPASLEILFHEASHALAGEVREGILRECRARNKPTPRELWHALLFYTTGEIVKRTLRLPPPAPEGESSSATAGGNTDYTPYAYRHGLYARGWQSYQRVLERYWQPYLDGKTDFETALARLVAAL